MSPYIVSVSISQGGIPKLPVSETLVTTAGLTGDGHNHAKHNTPLQAVSILDWEDIEDLRAEGFPLVPGATGENLTVRNLNIDRMEAGAILKFSGGVVLELTKVRKPCYVLDAIDPQLKEAILGRCGFYAKVLREGFLGAGETITVRRWTPSALLPL